MSFSTAFQNTVSIRLTGQSSYTELCDFRHDLTESDEGHEVTSSCHNGVQAWVASILRGEITASFHIKDDQYPWDTGMRAQATGELDAQFGTGQSFFFPFFLSRAQHTNETAGGTDFNATFKLNGEAGTYSRP